MASIDYKKYGMRLRDLGILSSNFDFRKKLSGAQKAAITRKLETKEKHDDGKTYTFKSTLRKYIDNPSAYSTPSVKKKSASDLKQAGFTVSKKGRAFIPNGGALKVTIKRGKIYKEFANKKEKIFLATGESIFDLLETESAKKRDRFEMLALQIGDHNPFRRKFGTMAEIGFYLQYEMTYHGQRDVVQPLVSIISVTNKLTTNGKGKKKKRGH